MQPRLRHCKAREQCAAVQPFKEFTMYTIPLRSRSAAGLAFQRWLVYRLVGLARAE